MRVLLILGDDDGRAVGVLRRELSTLHAQEIPDGVAFAEALGAGEFDAALVGLRLGWADGAALAREANRRFPDRPVVLIAGEREETAALAALRQGADDYVVDTPGRLHRLPIALTAALERTRALRAASLAEAALRESEQKLRLVVGQLPCHVWTTDAELRVTSVAGAALAALGLDSTRYIGRTMPEITGDEEPLRAHARALAGEAVRYGRTVAGRTFEAHVQPLRDQEGEIVGCLGLALDVTERRQAERRDPRGSQRGRCRDRARRASPGRWSCPGT